MRKYNRRVILLLILLNLSFVLQAFDAQDFTKYTTSKNKKTSKKTDIIDPYPFSIYISLINGSIVPIRRPISNYFIEIPVTFGFGVGFEYRFTKWTAIDGSFYGDFGFSWERKNYGDTGALCDYCFIKDYTLDLLQLNVYLQQLFSLKLYTNEFAIKWKTIDPKNKAKKIDKLVNAKVFFRIGATLEAMIFSKYYLFRNGELLSEGNFLDEVPDGPNPYGQTVDYRTLINPVI